MSYAALEQKLRKVPEKDFDFVSRFLDLILVNANNTSEASNKNDYLAMLDRSFDQLERGEVVVKSMDELRAMETN
ncbi:MAG: hypothetical protein J5930_03995 [Treponema sp.]|nr:hypothetical protein [Treponema sp.]